MTTSSDHTVLCIKLRGIVRGCALPTLTSGLAAKTQKPLCLVIFLDQVPQTDE